MFLVSLSLVSYTAASVGHDRLLFSFFGAIYSSRRWSRQVAFLVIGKAHTCSKALRNYNGVSASPVFGVVHSSTAPYRPTN